MAEVAVLYLVRKGNDPDMLKRFLSAYKKHMPKVSHDLIIIWKNFDNTIDEIHNEIIKKVNRVDLFVPDDGYDIESYRLAINIIEYKYICFLNSHSEPICDEWLDNMHSVLSKKNVGLVGCTGSWQSHHSLFLGVLKHVILVTIFRKARKMSKKQSQTINKKTSSNCKREVTNAQSLLQFILYIKNNWKYLVYVKPYPNPHIRTNAFMCEMETLKKVDWVSRTKFECYLFESGRKSIMNQVLNLNQQVYIVGRNKRAYSYEEWHISDIFWQNEQSNLMIADNQTRKYQKGNSNTRISLSWSAWQNACLRK